MFGNLLEQRFHRMPSVDFFNSFFFCSCDFEYDCACYEEIITKLTKYPLRPGYYMLTLVEIKFKP